MKNAVFFCLDGIKYNGHDYIEEAIKNGAKVIVYSEPQDVKYNAIYIKVNNVSNALVKCADIFYNNPNDNIEEYIVCGNYGRCSVTSFINDYLNKVSNCAYIGILGIRYNGLELNSNYTTLNLLDNMRLMDTLKKNDVKAVTFEANAASLNLQKLDGIRPECFIYTCTSHSSSEYQTNDYFAYIRRYMYTLESDTKVVLNADDESLNEINYCVDNYVTYGTNTISDYQIRDISVSRKGISYKIIHEDKTYAVKSALQGRINVYNLTAAIAALNEMGYNLEDIIEKMSDVKSVEGVMENVDDEYNIIIDCAYDLSSLEKVCEYASNVKQKNKSIGVISINATDSEKRLEKIMDIVQKYLDVIILTENESLESEVMEILSRCNKFVHKERVINIPLRSSAIENAIEIMNKNDTLIIVGKGNERFLSMGLGKEFYYGDKHYAKKYIDKRRREENEII